MSPEKQLHMWVLGESVHNEELDECCPDFSCCDRKLLAPEEERYHFAKAVLENNASIRSALLMRFLGRLLKSQGATAHVHIVGQS